jgi:hypothetical protein
VTCPYLEDLPKELHHFAHGIKRRTEVLSQKRHYQEDLVFVSRILKDFVYRYAMVARIGGDGISREEETNVRLVWMHRLFDDLEKYELPVRYSCSI